VRARLGGPQAVLVALLAALPAGAVRALDPLDALVGSYPEALVGHDGRTLRWRDGTASPAGDGGKKTFEELLHHPSIVDQFAVPYRRGPSSKPPAPDEDPGRFRNAAFFRKMYGDCDKGEVTGRLVPVAWLPKAWGKPVRITAINRVDERLRAVSAEIDAMPDHIRKAAYPSAGTFNCRVVADTKEPSPHAYGIAIDLNLAYSDYWFWKRSPSGAVAYRNRMPEEIVAAFERHGFIWGGKWYHYDTMHFEYRPELLKANGAAQPETAARPKP
jgi:hypothetical protein